MRFSFHAQDAADLKAMVKVEDVKDGEELFPPAHYQNINGKPEVQYYIPRNRTVPTTLPFGRISCSLCFIVDLRYIGGHLLKGVDEFQLDFSCNGHG